MRTIYTHTKLLCGAAMMMCGSAGATEKQSAHAAQSATAHPLYIEQSVFLKSNETIGHALERAGLPAATTQKAAAALMAEKDFNPRTLKAGQELALRYTDKLDGSPVQIDELAFHAGGDKIVKVNRTGDTYNADVKERALKTEQSVVVGTIEDSLYQSASKAGLPASLVVPFVNMFAWDMDFTRDIQPGNRFHVIYESVRDAKTGEEVRPGIILAAEIEAKGKMLSAYHLKETGEKDVFDANGFNKRRSLLMTPLEFARISSSFDLHRRHPVLGYTRAHKGTDFAAPMGTPVKASGDGTVAFVGKHGGHGNFIQIKHNGTYTTGYAHLSGYARNLRVGQHVSQGQIIGYVGSTGISTGPHLHYELVKNGTFVNAMTQQAMLGGTPVPSNKAKFFKSFVTEAKLLWRKEETKQMVAQAGTKRKTS